MSLRRNRQSYVNAVTRTGGAIYNMARQARNIYGVGKRIYNSSRPFMRSVPTRPSVVSYTRSPLTRRPMNMKRSKGKLLKKCPPVKPLKRKFVANVNRVIDMDTPSGIFKFYNNATEWMNQRGVQLVRTAPPININGLAQQNYNDFSWQSVWAAVSYMYKNLQPTLGPSIQNSGFDNSALGVFQFDFDTKVFVEKMSSKYIVKNNMNVTIVLTHYTCFPKTSDSENPADVWATAITTAYPGPQLKTNVDVGAVANYPFVTRDPSFLNDAPTSYPLFNSKFRVVKKTKTLLPGQSYTASRVGGCQVWYDYAKARATTLTGTFYSNTPGKNQWSMFVAHPVMLNEQGQKLQATSYGVNVPTALEGTVIIEHFRYFQIRAPAETAIADKHNVLVRQNWVFKSTTPDARLVVQGKVMDNKLVV